MSRHDEHRRDEKDTTPIHTRAGTSDGLTETGEPMTGAAGRETQEEASGFWEQIGATIEGKHEGEVHEPSTKEDERR
jgi:hypothetical protein